MSTNIFSPTRLGALELANRIVMAPMTRDRAGPDSEPTGLMAQYYAQRASAGLIVAEGTQPSRDGQGYFRTPGIYSPKQIEGWRRVAEAVHAEGGRIVVQLMHCGRASVRANKEADAETVAPSAIRSREKIPGPDGVPVDPDEPRALTTGEVGLVIEQFGQAARNARMAGLDGVELHCASGYLPMQFLSTNTNQRTDRYGGSTANRIRFVVECLEEMAGAIGADRVGFRICPTTTYNDIHDADPADTYSALLRAVQPLNLANLHLINFRTQQLDPLQLVKAHWSGPVILNNELTLESAQAALDAGDADAVSFGRPFVSNPDLVERFRCGAPLARLERATLYTGEERGYIDYPRWDAGR